MKAFIIYDGIYLVAGTDHELLYQPEQESWDIEDSRKYVSKAERDVSDPDCGKLLF